MTEAELKSKNDKKKNDNRSQTQNVDKQASSINHNNSPIQHHDAQNPSNPRNPSNENRTTHVASKVLNAVQKTGPIEHNNMCSPAYGTVALNADEFIDSRSQLTNISEAAAVYPIFHRFSNSMNEMHSASLGHGYSHNLHGMNNFISKNYYQNRGRLMANLAQQQVNNTTFMN